MDNDSHALMKRNIDFCVSVGYLPYGSSEIKDPTCNVFSQPFHNRNLLEISHRILKILHSLPLECLMCKQIMSLKAQRASFVSRRVFLTAIPCVQMRKKNIFFSFFAVASAKLNRHPGYRGCPRTVDDERLHGGR